VTIRTTGRQPAAHAFGREVIATLSLGWPIALTQIGQIAMLTTDLALIGRLGDVALAGAALGHIVLFAGYMLGLGLAAAVAPLAAQAVGARKPRMVRRAARVGLWAITMVGIPLTIALLYAAPVLVLLGQPPDASAYAGYYLAGMAWSLIPAWAFIVLRNMMAALGRPQPALWIMLAAIPLNGLLAFVLIFGWGPLPAFGITGAGIATSIVNIAMCVAGFLVTARMRPYRKYHLFGRIWRPDWPLLARLFRLGVPITGAFMLEYGLFAGAGLMAGAIGKSALAAHQIALQVASILFMVPMGLSQAATVRVGHALGRGDLADARRAGFAALLVAGVFMAVFGLATVALRGVIPAVFLDVAASANAETVALAAVLLIIGASFAIADGMQAVGAGALRGLGDTRVPMQHAAVSFWVIGFPVAWVLCFPAGLGAAGIWSGLTAGLVLYAVLLVWRFERLTRAEHMGRLPGVAASRTTDETDRPAGTLPLQSAISKNRRPSEAAAT